MPNSFEEKRMKLGTEAMHILECLIFSGEERSERIGFHEANGAAYIRPSCSDMSVEFCLIRLFLSTPAPACLPGTLKNHSVEESRTGGCQIHLHYRQQSQLSGEEGEGKRTRVGGALTRAELFSVMGLMAPVLFEHRLRLQLMDWGSHVCEDAILRGLVTKYVSDPAFINVIETCARGEGKGSRLGTRVPALKKAVSVENSKQTLQKGHALPQCQQIFGQNFKEQ
ncbi:hypothetical protein DNTS_035492 [Danionella cerebrum]|uniref:Uncharacterized protein n=1 Tax=Danionella cerebrum TaxID=2873325 RepID=A0A553R678_9TELE|nr:hypothetical protein DNTS_035492 [Danionella translucida]